MSQNQGYYHGVATEDVVKHLTGFVSGLWQIHPFGEGNTRTTAVFTILYLRSIGFNVENDLFAKNSWYFQFISMPPKSGACSLIWLTLQVPVQVRL